MTWLTAGWKGSLWDGGARASSFLHSPLLKSVAGRTYNGLVHISDWVRGEFSHRFNFNHIKAVTNQSDNSVGSFSDMYVYHRAACALTCLQYPTSLVLAGGT